MLNTINLEVVNELHLSVQKALATLNGTGGAPQQMLLNATNRVCDTAFITASCALSIAYDVRAIRDKIVGPD